MKTLFLKPLNWFKLIIPAFALICFTSCGGGDDDDDGPGTEDLAASFQYEIDENDFLTVQFSNFSRSATSYSWDFGDNNSSTEKDPTHTYDRAGEYTVTLTSSNSAGISATRSETIILTDPNSLSKLLTGETSKTWKLYREGTSMSLGPNADSPTEWWGGLANDGSRSCLYEQEITFHFDGTYEFDDKGMFWTEYGVFNNNDCDVNVTAEQCIESTAENLVNSCGDDVSAWGSGKHSFEYDVATGSLTLTGLGAWIGIPKLGTSGETITPVSSVTTKISIEEFTGFDVMLVEFIYDDAYWPIRYASYSDPSLEPQLETEAQEFGEDLPDITPTELSLSFLEADTSSFQVPESSGSFVSYGAPDPAGGTDLVGEFIRTEAQYQEFQFQTAPEKNDINFANLTTVSIDVYFPSTNDYSGDLTKNVIIGFGDLSQTEEWWNDLQQYERDGSDFAEDEWITINFELNMPTFVSKPDNGETPYERNDYDMIFINIGSSGHTVPGTFYVRNLNFK